MGVAISVAAPMIPAVSAAAIVLFNILPLYIFAGVAQRLDLITNRPILST